VCAACAADITCRVRPYIKTRRLLATAAMGGLSTPRAASTERCVRRGASVQPIVSFPDLALRRSAPLSRSARPFRFPAAARTPSNMRATHDVNHCPGASTARSASHPTLPMRTSFAIASALVSILCRNAQAQATAPTPDARATVIAVADSALAAITRGDVVALTDLMVPEAVMFPTSTRDGITAYRVRTREAQRTIPLTGIVERGFQPQALVNGGVAIVWMPYDLYVNGAWSHCGADAFTLVKSNGTWRIAALAWSAEQPPVCDKHPAGPPVKR